MTPALLDLPREIRELIYHAALVSPTGYVLLHAPTAADEQSGSYQITPVLPSYQGDDVIYNDTNYTLDLDDDARIWLALLQTCRDVHDEALPVFFSHHIFCFGEPAAYTRFVDRQPAAAARMRRIMLDCARKVPLHNLLGHGHRLAAPFSPAALASRAFLHPTIWSRMVPAIYLLADQARHGSLHDLRLRLSQPTLHMLYGDARWTAAALTDAEPAPVRPRPPSPESARSPTDDTLAFLSWAAHTLADARPGTPPRVALVLEAASINADVVLSRARACQRPALDAILGRLHAAFGGRLVLAHADFDVDKTVAARAAARREVVLWEQGCKRRPLWVDEELKDVKCGVDQHLVDELWTFAPMS